MNITHDIKQGAYSFTTQEGDFTDRFEIVFKPSTLSTDLISTSVINIYSDNVGININSSETINSIDVFDILGRVLYTKNNVNVKEFTINNLIKNNQPLIVKVKDVNGSVKSQKIVF
ncbi:MAG: T9SS sorting signal type C domain-containing protein [Flavobacteriaceae bacterium]|nr:T9SS sorting signal type C domain-containing protein [Flavobacteriaceae bacterium]